MNSIPTANGGPTKRLKVRLVLDSDNRDWIVGKFASRLQENLGNWGVDADIGEAPSRDVDLNHWMIYGHPWGFFFQERRQKLTKSTMMITHVDDPIKLKMIREVLREVVDVGICMSRMTAEELIGRGIPREQLCYVTPAHDGAVLPRRLVIGITSRVYPDGRKREHLLARLAEILRLDLFHFDILGRGWDEVIPCLEKAGATVRYYPGTDDYVRDYAVMRECIQGFDYYLYTGLDEGSMGLLDALAAGAKTIVTKQGFHLDIEGGITHGFLDGDELVEIFRCISKDRERVLGAVKNLTWNVYARQHSILWRALLEGRQADIPALLQPGGGTLAKPVRSRFARAAAEVRFYQNVLRSQFLRRYLVRRKWQVRYVLSRIKSRVLGHFRD